MRPKEFRAIFHDILTEEEHRNPEPKKNFWLLPSGKIIYLQLGESHGELVNENGWFLDAVKLNSKGNIRGVFGYKGLLLSFHENQIITKAQTIKLREIIINNKFEYLDYNVFRIEDGDYREVVDGTIGYPDRFATVRMLEELETKLNIRLK